MDLPQFDFISSSHTVTKWCCLGSRACFRFRCHPDSSPSRIRFVIVFTCLLCQTIVRHSHHVHARPVVHLPPLPIVSSPSQSTRPFHARSSRHKPRSNMANSLNCLDSPRLLCLSRPFRLSLALSLPLDSLLVLYYSCSHELRTSQRCSLRSVICLSSAGHLHLKLLVCLSSVVEVC